MRAWDRPRARTTCAPVCGRHEVLHEVVATGAGLAKDTEGGGLSDSVRLGQPGRQGPCEGRPAHRKRGGTGNTGLRRTHRGMLPQVQAPVRVAGGGSATGADVRIAGRTLGAEPVLIAGPCVLEEPERVLRIAEGIAEVAERRGVGVVFKASFDKANRTSGASPRGPGLDAGLELLARVKREVGLPLTTDVHLPHQAAPVAEVVDLLQVPAFLCRQTDLIEACGATGLPVNLKKGQFATAGQMVHAAEKASAAGASGVAITERGSCFGHGDLVVDLRQLVELREAGLPVIYGRHPLGAAAGGRGDRRAAAVRHGPGAGSPRGRRRCPVRRGPRRPGPGLVGFGGAAAAGRAGRLSRADLRRLVDPCVFRSKEEVPMTRVHLSLKTADLAATTAFYTALFGEAPDKEREGYARFQPADVPVTLSLSPGLPTPGAHHFGVKLPDAAASRPPAPGSRRRSWRARPTTARCAATRGPTGCGSRTRTDGAGRCTR